jgi:hypothetical protein
MDINKKGLPALVLAGFCLLASGCGSMRPSGPPEALDCGLDRFVVRDIYEDWGVFRAKQSRLEALDSPNPSFNILALSAGGEFGAYGAGFLSGWRSIGRGALPGPRTDIQIVTGVSTGAILATHAFLGKDDEIEAKYRSLSGDQVYKSRSLLELIRANSLLSADGKDRLIEENVTDDVIDEVARAVDGRFLYIGLVDLDSGRFLRIDMLRLARGLQPSKLRNSCYRAVVGASSAIPIAFPPKFIDDMMLVDGGARRHLFITELPKEAKLPNVERRLFSLVHGDLDVGCSKTKNGVLQIAGRSADLLTDQGFKDSIRLADSLAKEPVEDGSSKPLMKTYYAAAADAARACQPTRVGCQSPAGTLSEDMFCQAFMNCLADHGKEDGRAVASGNRQWLQLRDLNLSTQPNCGSTPSQRSLTQ